MPTAHPYEQLQNRATHAPANPPDNIVERCQAMLFTLAELGADFARQIHAAATTAAEWPGVDHGPMLDRASQAFDRTTAGVRRTVLLIDKLAHPAPITPPATRPATGPATEPERNASIQAAATAPTRPDRLDILRPERLERVERPESLGDRPLEQVVTAILADLGFANVTPAHPTDPAASTTEPPEPAPPRSDPPPHPPQRTLLRPTAIPDG